MEKECEAKTAKTMGLRQQLLTTKKAQEQGI